MASLYFKYGTMDAGKSANLLMTAYNYEKYGKRVLLLKPMLDTRNTNISSRIGLSSEAVCIDSKDNVFDIFKKENSLDVAISAVLVDEVQFFKKDIVDLCERLANSGVRVICAGLDLDFRGEPFGIMPKLLSRAEFVTKLNAICTVCGAPATRTQRIINGRPADYDDPIILVSASEKYEARCRFCHQVPHKNYGK